MLFFLEYYFFWNIIFLEYYFLEYFFWNIIFWNIIFSGIIFSGIFSAAHLISLPDVEELNARFPSINISAFMDIKRRSAGLSGVTSPLNPPGKNSLEEESASHGGAGGESVH